MANYLFDKLISVLSWCTAQARPFMVCCSDTGFVGSTIIDISFMCGFYCRHIVLCRLRRSDRPTCRMKYLPARLITPEKGMPCASLVFIAIQTKYRLPLLYSPRSKKVDLRQTGYNYTDKIKLARGNLRSQPFFKSLHFRVVQRGAVTVIHIPIYTGSFRVT